MVKEWDDISQSILIGLVNSMKRRCELIIESKGDRISGFTNFAPSSIGELG